MKDRQKLKLGDTHITPINIQKLQGQSLGIPKAPPSSSTK
jgi:hypothetical protein